MTPDVTHHIRHCTFTILAEGEENALRLRPELSSLIKGRLFRLIGEVFAEMDGIGTTRIERLKIDLGDIELSGWEHTLEEKLRSSLREALLEMLVGSSGQRSGGCNFVDSARCGLEKLRYFLLYGCFPWWADRDSSFEQLFGAILESNAGELLDLIRATCHQEYVISRIVFQSDGRLLERLIERMQLPFERFILEYISDVNNAHQHAPLVNTGSKEFERTIWLLTLTYLLMDRGSEFNKRAFVKWNIDRIARRYGMSYESLLFFLAGCLKNTAVGFSFRPNLMAIIGQLSAEQLRSGSVDAVDVRGPVEPGGGLAQEPRVELVQEPAGPRAEEAPDFLSFRSFLIHGEWVPSIGNRSAAEIFGLLLERSRGPVRQLVEKWGREEAVQERIRRELPVAEVIRLLEPGEYEFIVSYAAELKRSHQEVPAIKVSSAAFEKVVWKLILNYLMMDRGSDFNRKSFLRWNLSRIAAEYNISYVRLLDFMLQSLRSLPAGLARESSLPALFDDLAQDLWQAGENGEPEVHAALKEHSDVDGGVVLSLFQPGSASLLKEYWKWIRQAADLGLIPGGTRNKERYHTILLRHLLHPGGRLFNAAVFFEETLHELLTVPGSNVLTELPPDALDRAHGLSAPLMSMVGKALAAVSVKKITTGMPKRKLPLPAAEADPGGLRPKFALGASSVDVTPLYIRNAGLILLHPFFPRYFDLLHLLDTDARGRRQFASREASYKGVHALQWLVDGTTDSPEQELLLNKLLCGLPPEEPVPRSVEFSDTEKSIGESLLKGAIQNWTIIRDSSVGALQTFLRREGRLGYRDQDRRWDLEVENKTVDILIDQIPWSIAVIQQDWMPQTIYVKWRN